MKLQLNESNPGAKPPDRLAASFARIADTALASAPVGTPNCTPRRLAQYSSRAMRCCTVNRDLDTDWSATARDALGSAGTELAAMSVMPHAATNPRTTASLSNPGDPHWDRTRRICTVAPPSPF